VDEAVAALSSLMEPAIMVILGVLIGGWWWPCTCPSSNSARWCNTWRCDGAAVSSGLNYRLSYSTNYFQP
jgi:hypothetical protein